MKKKCIEIVTILLLFFIPTGICQSGYDNLTFYQQDKNERLAQSHILCIFQDSFSFLWFGTYSGLYRYDGYNFIRYSDNLFNHSDFTDNGIHSIFEDNQKQLWVGSENGLYKINRSTGIIQHFKKDAANPNSLINNYIKCIKSLNDTVLLIGTYGGGLDIYNPLKNTFKAFTYQSGDSLGITSNLVNTIYIDHDKEIWIGTEGGGICILDWHKGQFRHFPLINKKLYPDNTINAFQEDREGNIWIGTWNEGLFKYDRQSDSFVSYRNKTEYGMNDRNIHSITTDWQGNIWFATYGGGIGIYDFGQNRFIKYKYLSQKEKRTSQQYLWSLYKDNNDIMWIGTFGSGIYYYNKNKLNVRDLFSDNVINNQLNELIITSLVEDDDKSVWIGTLGNGVYTYNPVLNRLQNIINKPGQSINIVRSAYKDREGRKWIGTDGGLIRINKNNTQITYYKPDLNNPNSISDNGIYAIREDSEGNIWLGIWGKGLNILGKSEIEKTNSATAIFKKIQNLPGQIYGLSGNNVRGICEGPGHKFYIASSKGLDLYDKNTGKFKHLCNYDVSSIYIDLQGKVWVSTFGNGVLLFDNGVDTFKIINTDNGLNSNIVYGFCSDNKSNIWIITNTGINCYSQGKSYLKNYSNVEDLEIKKIGLKAFYKDTDGRIVFGGEKGLKVVDPSTMADDNTDFPVYITDIKLFNKSIRNKDRKYTDFSSVHELTLGYKQNIISFEFAALNYTMPEKVQYAYKLEGFDSDWVYTDASHRIATYTNLKGGTYHFLLRSMNQNGLWNKNESTIKLTVIPPFWQTGIFKFIIVLVLMILIVLIIRMREKHLREEFLFKEELLKSENIIIENKELKKQTETVEKEIRDKHNELTASAVQIIGKNQALSTIRGEISDLLPHASGAIRNKLEKVIFRINQNLNDESSWEKLNLNFNLIQDNFLSRFAEAYPSITHKDLKVCAYIRINLTNEEIASLLNISGRSLEMCRYRIRKKIKLDKKTQLNDFILRF